MSKLLFVTCARFSFNTKSRKVRPLIMFKITVPDIRNWIKLPSLLETNGFSEMIKADVKLTAPRNPPHTKTVYCKCVDCFFVF